MGALPKIHVVEPPSILTMHGFFNAAFLDTCARAFPNRGVAFHASPGHLDQVRGIVRGHSPEIEAAIEWVAEPEPTAKDGKIPAPAMGKAMRAALRHDFVIFTSTTRMAVAMMRVLMAGRRRGGVLAILHGELDTLLEPTPPFPRSLASLSGQFRHRMPAPLRFVLLGRSIADHVPEASRPALADAVVMDIPYHFLPPSDAPPDPDSFGVLGNCGRAIELGEFARGLRERRPEASVRLVGCLDSLETAARIGADVMYAEARLVERETFVARARALRYIAWLAPKDSYRLRASATFFDALAFGKPFFYTKNPYLDGYHALDPRIGVRCEDVPDLVEKAAQTVGADDEGAYQERRRAILAFRERFTPPAMAPALRAAIGWEDA